MNNLSNNLRYERKYAVSGISVHGAEEIIKNHPSFFREIYEERYVNNIYLDTQNLTHYYDNVSGKSQRKKYRIRWYHDLSGEIKQPVLEIKIKNGLLGRKESYVLHHFEAAEGKDLLQVLKTCLDKSRLPEKISEEMSVLFPTLLNRYRRKYFLDFSKKYRVTLDSDIEYCNIMNGKMRFNKKVLDNKLVTELKYNEKDIDDASFISSQFPFRLTKNSKYINGIKQFYGVSD